ncbi:MAG: hypothetical protein HYR49_03975 [Gammaproteobacteria bacterium]|nr:hypothetical protein [Gammaproteobacteria bacterium]
MEMIILYLSNLVAGGWWLVAGGWWLVAGGLTQVGFHFAIVKYRSR